MDFESLTVTDLMLLVKYMTEENAVGHGMSREEEYEKQMKTSVMLSSTRQQALKAFCDLCYLRTEVTGLLFRMDLIDMPLYINDPDPVKKAIVRWRLKLAN